MLVEAVYADVIVAGGARQRRAGKWQVSVLAGGRVADVEPVSPLDDEEAVAGGMEANLAARFTATAEEGPDLLAGGSGGSSVTEGDETARRYSAAGGGTRP